MSRTRYRSGLSLLAGFFLLAALFAILLYLLMPETPATRGPLLLAAFVAILLGSLLCILFLLRRFCDLTGNSLAKPRKLRLLRLPPLAGRSRVRSGNLPVSRCATTKTT